MKPFKILSIFCLFFTLLSGSVFLDSCQKKTETAQEKNAAESKVKYSKYLQGLWNSLKDVQKKALEAANNKISDGGIPQDDLGFAQEEIDRLVALRLLKSNPNTRKYEITSLGEDIFKQNANVDLPKAAENQEIEKTPNANSKH
ncbi:MAG: hypothetical protein SFU25_09590 [Candidatus Caenarcaniphilales bacterium]|nr:hypothetical protein [Candidatus Caenarcaniphilales bacterium]